MLKKILHKNKKSGGISQTQETRNAEKILYSGDSKASAQGNYLDNDFRFGDKI